MTIEKTEPVVVGVDGGPGSAGALRYAVTEARRHGRELHLVHVSPSYPPMSPVMPSLPVEIARTGTAILDDARAEVARMAPELTVRATRHTGPRIAELVDTAKDARLLVIGHETRSAVERMIGAGTTAAVSAHATVPVVVVPAEWQPSDETGAIVVGLKSGAHADELLGAAFHRAADVGAPVEVVHAWKLPDPYFHGIEERTEAAAWIRQGQKLVERQLAPWRRDFPQVPVTVSVVHEDPALALIEAAREARLVIVVRRLPSHLLGPHLGGTARAVLRAAQCPVEVVPASRTVTETPGLELERSGAILR